jgi:predicted nucleic acid-binding protein
MSEFVDANLFLRFLTSDDPHKARQTGELFQRASEGEFELITSEAIVAEVVYVLSSSTLYGRGRSAIAHALKALFTINAVNLDYKPSILHALDLYETTTLDFEDCLAAAHAMRATNGRIYSYDKGFARIAGLTRLEPQFDDESNAATT